MRVWKHYTTDIRYRHDGQMGIEDVEHTTAGAVSAVTRYGLGARGVDFIERQVPGGSTTEGFPIYDAHGNMVATLSRSGTNGYSVADRRGYSAWGDVRGSGQTGDPKGRYCANLGHRMDDESGTVYMRARYYQPTEGRFLSEDPAMQGANWFAYCGNNPVGRADKSGGTAEEDAYLIAATAAFCTTVGGWIGSATVGSMSLDKVVAGAIGYYFRFIISLGKGFYENNGGFKNYTEEELKRKLRSEAVGGFVTGGAIGVIAAIKLGQHTGNLMSELFYIDYWEDIPV